MSDNVLFQRRDFKDASVIKTSSGNLLFSLLDVWKPVQQEASRIECALTRRIGRR